MGSCWSLERLQKGGGELRMPLGQRIPHTRPEGCLGIRDLRGEAIIDARESRLEVVGRAPEAVSAPSAGSIREDSAELPQTVPSAREGRTVGVLTPRSLSESVGCNEEGGSASSPDRSAAQAFKGVHGRRACRRGRDVCFERGWSGRVVGSHL